MSGFSANCPRCGSLHKLQPDKLDEQMQCRGCKTLFYLAASGKYVIGQKPAGHAKVDPFAPVEITSDDFRGAELFDRIPRVAYMTAAGVVVVIFAVVALAWTLWPRWEPEGLEERARFVAEAFARDEQQRIAMLRTPGDPRHIRNWIRKSRPDSWTFAPDQPVEVQAEILIQDTRAGIAYVLATIAAPGETAGAGSVKGSAASTRVVGKLELPLFWTLDDEGQWRLDAARCFREGPRAH